MSESHEQEEYPSSSTVAKRGGLSNIPEPVSKSSVSGAAFNLTNAIVGSGIIGIPFAVRESGWLLGIALLFFVSWLAVQSLRIIVETANFHPQLKPIGGVKTYEDLMFLPYGHIGSLFILINKFIFAYGSMVAYLLIIKDTVPVVFGVSEYHAQRQIVMVITSLVVVLPLSLLRDMANLSYTSLLSVTADVILIIFMIVFSPIQESIPSHGGVASVLVKNAFNTHLFIGLGIISQAMTCHPMSMIISESLKEKTSKNWSCVAGSSLSIACILCVIMGITGFFGFLDTTQGDILNNFEDGSTAANGSRGLVAITMIFTYPMQSFVARHVLAKLFFNGDTEGTGMVTPEGEPILVSKCLGCIGRREKITIGIYIATLVPALIFDDLGPVLSITGSIGGSCLAYIGPGLIYLGAYGEDFMTYTNEMMKTTKHTTTTTDPAIELPVAGDAEATMESTTTAGPQQEIGGTSSNGSTPWWWCFALMPIWRSIASTGSLGMKMRLEQLQQQQDAPVTIVTTTPETDNGNDEIITSTHRRFYLAMFMVLFGILAMVAGVISNVYVQLQKALS